jgi:hypothetical protein
MIFGGINLIKWVHPESDRTRRRRLKRLKRLLKGCGQPDRKNIRRDF